MLETIAFIPIKTRSTRVPGKNFRHLNGVPLYEHIIINAIMSKAFDKIYIDTDSDIIKEFASDLNCEIIHRPQYMTKDNINGNGLLIYDSKVIKEGKYLFQLFATAPFLKPDTINSCVNFLKDNLDNYDSVFTATEESGWFWFMDIPVNYDPSELPRSQDAKHLIKESTGLYGITRDSLNKNKCRIGSRPYPYLINSLEAIDLDTEEDFKLAEIMGRSQMLLPVDVD